MSPASTLEIGSQSIAIGDLTALRLSIRDVLDFPKPGVIFKDIMPLLADARCFQLAVNTFIEVCRALPEAGKLTKIVGIDARGFLFGAAVAYGLGVGFVPVRKAGKLPGKTEALSYRLEYGEATVEMPAEGLNSNDHVVLIDDLLATGGTAAAALELIRKFGAKPMALLFLIELTYLHGREKLQSSPPIGSLLSY